MNKVLGVGIIGAGVIFDKHARALGALSERARLVGLAETDDARRGAATDKFFIPVASSDYRQLLKRDDIDIISVCTPPCLHEEMVLAAMQAGKYVICEKPLAHTLESADRIIQVAKEYPNRLTTVYQLRYLPEVQKVVWLRDQGLLGKLHFGQFTRYATLSGSSAEKTGWWGRWNVAGGGAVMTQFIHHLDQMVYLFGRPVEVAATMDTFKQPIESEDSFAAMVRFENGAIASCCSTVAAHHFGYTFDVIGHNLSAHYPWALNCGDRGLKRQVTSMLNKAFPTTKQQSRGLASRVIRKLRHKLGFGTSAKDVAGVKDHVAYLRAVLQSIDSSSAMPVPPDDARASIELCTAIYTSSITRRPVSLPLDSMTAFYRGITRDDYSPQLEPQGV